LSRLMVPTVAMPEAKENWRDGIDLVRSFMKDVETGYTDEYGAPIYKTRFHVDINCVRTINEFNNYKANEPVKGRNVPEVGQKAQDHAMDAIRYGLVHIYKLGAVYHLSDVLAHNTPGANKEGLSGIITPSDSGYFTMAGSF